jgi:hypothetical protein
VGDTALPGIGGMSALFLGLSRACVGTLPRDPTHLGEFDEILSRHGYAAVCAIAPTSLD